MIKYGLLILLIFVTLNYVLSQEKPKKYFGQTPHGDAAESFYAGTFFEKEYNRKRSFGFAFSPNGKELFFSFVKRTPEKPEPAYEIKKSNFVNNAN